MCIYSHFRISVYIIPYVYKKEELQHYHITCEHTKELLHVYVSGRYHKTIRNMIIKMIKAILQKSNSPIQEEQNSPKVFNN